MGKSVVVGLQLVSMTIEFNDDTKWLHLPDSAEVCWCCSETKNAYSPDIHFNNIEYFCWFVESLSKVEVENMDDGDF